MHVLHLKEKCQAPQAGLLALGTARKDGGQSTGPWRRPWGWGEAPWGATGGWILEEGHGAAIHQQAISPSHAVSCQRARARCSQLARRLLCAGGVGAGVGEAGGRKLPVGWMAAPPLP